MTLEIASFVTALGHATNILKAAIDARDESKRREALSELTGAMTEVNARQLAVQQNQLALLQENEALKKQIAAYDEWEKQKKCYSLRTVGSGGFVYAFNPAEQTSDPPHWLCPNCYERRDKSILQFAAMETGDTGKCWRCPKCKLGIIAHTDWPQALK